jgi:uncharacterized membrane protein YciS (DUF1049 family)
MYFTTTFGSYFATLFSPPFLVQDFLAAGFFGGLQTFLILVVTTFTAVAVTEVVDNVFIASATFNISTFEAGTALFGITSIAGKVNFGRLFRKAKVSFTSLDIAGTVDPGNIHSSFHNYF